MKIFKKLSAFLCSATVLLSFFTAFSITPVSAAATATAAAAGSITLRVEGQKSTLYSGSVSFTQGQDFYDIMAAALAAKNVPLIATNGCYGHEIVSIGSESGTYPVWWHLYVNGKASDVGADSLKPASGDEIVFYLGDDSVMLYPTVTLSNKYPVAGQKTTVNVSAAYTDYSDSSNPVTKSVKISGVTITLDGKSYTTNSDGNAVITMPASGSYTMTAVKDTKDATTAIVRTGSIPVTVYTASTVPTDSTSSGSSTVITTPAQTSVTSSSISAAISSGGRYIKKSGISDWGASLAYALTGGSVPQSYFDSVTEDISSGGTDLPTHLAGVIIGLKAAGANPRSFGGNDLVAQLYNNSKLGKTGLNGYTYSLLAFDSGNYTIPSSAAMSRQKIIDSILSYQKPSGAFSLDKNTADDSDMTAIAVTALAPYIKEADVKAAVDSAVSYLSKAQKADGGYLPSYSTSEDSESTAQVIIALASVGVDPLNDTRFVKNSSSLLNALMEYKNSDGSFAHTSKGGSDLMATEQTVTALTAFKRYQSSGARVYDLTGIKSVTVTARTANPDTGDAGNGAVLVMTSASVLMVLVLAKKRKRG